MLANCLADVVAEEAAKRLLPDMNSEKKAMRTERIDVSVAKRLALVQADIWAKHEEAGDIYELDELLAPTEASALSSLEKLVGEIANTGHLLVRHWSGLRCQLCNIYRARRQFKILEQDTMCSFCQVPINVIASFRAKKRQHSIAFSPHLADDTSVFRAHSSASDFSTPVPTENRQINTEHNHGMDTPQPPFAPILKNTLAGTIPLFLDMDSGVKSR